MSRTIPLILFVIVLAAPFALRAWVKTSNAPANAAASGATRTLIVITPHNPDIRREFARAFNTWHALRYGQGVVIDYRTPGGTNDIKRQLADTYRSWRDAAGTLDPNFVPDAHVAWGGGPFFYDKELKPLNVLQPMRINRELLAASFPSPALAGVRLYEESTDAKGLATPKWIGVVFSAFGIVYNPDIFRSLGIKPPLQWGDLTDPRLAGQIALADPTHSGSAATAYMIVLERRMADAEEAVFVTHPELKQLAQKELPKDARYASAIAAGWKRGMGELLLIAANGRAFVDSAPQVPQDVGNGDAAAGIAIDFYGRVYEDVVGPGRCKVVLPEGATAINPDPVAILEGVKGDNLELATRFVEFLLTPEGQRLWILRRGTPGGPIEHSLRRPPVRIDLYQDRTNWTDDLNPFVDSHGFNDRADFAALFSDTRPVWTAAWIDSREALKSAYAAILRVGDVKRRDELLVELADFPITMQDVANARAHRKRLEDSGENAEEWKAKNRIEMTKAFRAHFDRVRAKAR
jgi:iron(III) transport system substrate-binding protein